MDKTESKNSIYYPPPEDRRCTAMSKQSGLRCGRWAAKGKSVCYYHGARSTGPRTKEGLERSRMARFVHGESALDILKLRLLKKVLAAAAHQYSTLQVFPEYITAKVAKMNGRQFRDFRKDLVDFSGDKISLLKLITMLDGKKPKPICWRQSDKDYLKRIEKCLMDVFGISENK